MACPVLASPFRVPSRSKPISHSRAFGKVIVRIFSLRAFRAQAVLLKEAGEPGAPQTSASSSVIPSTGHASRLRRCSRVVSISLRKLLARVRVCDVYAHTDGFPFDPKD